MKNKIILRNMIHNAVVFLVVAQFFSICFVNIIEATDEVEVPLSEKNNQLESSNIASHEEEEHIFYQEDFEDDWIDDNDGDLAPKWWRMEQTSTEVNVGFPCWWHQMEEYGSNFSKGAGVWWGNDWQNEWLIMQPLDFSLLTGVKLQFWTWNYGYVEGYMEYDLVKVSTDWGVTWDELTNLYIEAPSGGGYFGEVVEYSLSDYEGEQNVLIAFHRMTENPNANFAEWIIDDIFITVESIIPMPSIDIKCVNDGKGVTAILKNIGTDTARNVEWSIDVSGRLVLFGRHHEGIIQQDIEPGEEVKIQSGFILAIGASTVKITVRTPREEDGRSPDIIIVKEFKAVIIFNAVKYWFFLFQGWVIADDWDFYPLSDPWNADWELEIEYSNINGLYSVRCRGYKWKDIVFIGQVNFVNGRATFHSGDIDDFQAVGTLSLGGAFWEILIPVADGHDKEEQTGQYDVGVIWTSDYDAIPPKSSFPKYIIHPNVIGFYNEICSLPNWQKKFDYGNEWAQETQFKNHKEGGENMVDFVDFVYFFGHGCGNMLPMNTGECFTFGTNYDPSEPNGGPDWYLESTPANREASWGKDLEFLVLDSCSILAEKGGDVKLSLEDRWKNHVVFNGLHYILGWASLTNGDYDTRGKILAKYLTGTRTGTPNRIRYAWEKTTHDTSYEPYKGAWLRAYGPGIGRDTFDDHLQGLGGSFPVAKDPIPYFQKFDYYSWDI